MDQTINVTNFNFTDQNSVYKGKVREVYSIGDNYLVMIASDRLSAFDVIMPRQIPFKGQILNQIASKMLAATKDLVPNWVVDVPDPNVTVGVRCEPFKVEMVIRAYLTGHAWREYSAGKRILCGVELPDGMKENERFPAPIITPTTKAEIGTHDEDISREEILSQGIVSEVDYLMLEDYTRKLFKRGTEMVADKGLILVDTKYEFGKTSDGEIVVIDEIHTPDSSRYFYRDSYQELLDADRPQRQLSKEFVRQWLIENGFQGKQGQSIPVISDEKIIEISERYIELYEKITGDKFIKGDTSNLEDRIFENVEQSIKSLA
ncbi:phosphoribosylaminoimidazolesuccinocarboxamide synthase [Flavobacteriaceae bacterium]|nr:phosphoribosylaminoimidazolesuccinocarboxamide synthase [Flavobacteriaceae bacterium]